MYKKTDLTLKNKPKFIVNILLITSLGLKYNAYIFSNFIACINKGFIYISFGAKAHIVIQESAPFLGA